MTAANYVHEYSSGTVGHAQVTTAVLGRPVTRCGGSPVERTRGWESPAGLLIVPPAPLTQDVVMAPAVREADALPVTLIIVTAIRNAATRKRIRTEFAELDGRLAGVDPNLVLPPLEHGMAGDFPYLLVPRPGETLEEVLAERGPLPVDEVAAAARALIAGVLALARHDVLGPPPAPHRTTTGELVLGTPLPPVVTELAGPRGHEPPEVLRGQVWTPAGQVYACASMLWTLLAGRPPFGNSEEGRLARVLGTTPPRLRRAGLDELVGITLTACLATEPELRPANLSLIAGVFDGEQGDGSHKTRQPSGSHPSEVDTHGARQFGSGYLLDRPIGRGAMGQVWAGRRRADGSPVAVKLLHRDLTEDTEAVRRFLRERATLHRLDHPNLVRVHDLVAEGDALGLVMDLIDGEDLRQHASRGRLSTSEVAALLAQAADALGAVHAAGVVHRDLKPENILVTDRDGRPAAVLTDFGIALAVNTQFTQLVCTPAYVAPELVAGSPPGPPADIYALGITAYELLAGRRPFDGPTAAALMDAHRVQPVPRPDGIDDAVWHVLAACLDKRPERRPDAARVAADWARLAEPGALHGSAPSPPSELDTMPPVVVPAAAEPSGAGLEELVETAAAERQLRPKPVDEPVRRRRRWPWVAAAAVVLAGTATGVYLAIPEQQAAAPKAGDTKTKSLLYPVPATVTVDGPEVATVSWNGDAAELPGFQAFLVFRVTPESRQTDPVSPNLPGDTTSHQVGGLPSGEKVCFTVHAYGVTAPPPKPPPRPACVTPPGVGQPR